MSSLEESRKTEMETHETLKQEHSALSKQLEDEKVCGVCKALIYFEQMLFSFFCEEIKNSVILYFVY